MKFDIKSTKRKSTKKTQLEKYKFMAIKCVFMEQ